MKVSPRSFILFIAVMFFSSCKKEEQFSIEPSSLYYKSSKEELAIKVFTGSGEIKDQSIINRFITLDSGLLKNYSINLFPNRGEVDTIRFIDLENARISEIYSYRDYSTVKQNSDLLLTSKIDLQLTNYGDPFTKTLGYWICQYKPPIHSEYLVSSTGGNYIFGYDTKELFVISTEKGVVKANWILMVARYTNGSFRVYSIQNKLDFNFYKSLKLTDTITLQQYIINYTKL
jgi:hypothetical protein